MFPSNGLVTRHPLSVFPSLRRLAAGRLRRFHRYYEGAVTSCRPSRRTSFPSFGGTTVPPGHFVPLRTGAPHGPGVGHPVSPAGILPWRRQDLRRSWGTLVCFCPALRPRPDLHIRPLRCVSAAPVGSTAKAPASGYFEAESHSLGTRCLRLAGQVTRSHARLASAAGQALPEGLVTLWGSCERFQFPSSVTSHPPFPS